jgi:hypothetical protein
VHVGLSAVDLPRVVEGLLGIVVHHVVHPVEDLPLEDHPLEDPLDDVHIALDLLLPLRLLPDPLFDVVVMIVNLLLKKGDPQTIRNLPSEREVGLILRNVVKDRHLRLHLNKLEEFS